MIATFIVVSSIALAAAFTIAWLVKPGFRRQIESPKHNFHDQVQRFDQQCNAAATKSGADSDESE